VKHSSIRILLALVAQYELKLDQLDVKIAFLHGDSEEDIYIQTSADGVQNCKKGEYGMQIEEIAI